MKYSYNNITILAINIQQRKVAKYNQNIPNKVFFLHKRALNKAFSLIVHDFKVAFRSWNKKGFETTFLNKKFIFLAVFVSDSITKFASIKKVIFKSFLQMFEIIS